MKSLSIDEAVAILKSGGIVAYPTETFYGLAVDPKNSQALEKLYALKERDRGKPISILIGSEEDLKNWVQDISPRAQSLIQQFWPGPLTLVLPAKTQVSSLLTAGTGTLGVRISPHPLASQLAKSMGAITTTSANLSGMDPLLDPQELEEMLGKKIDGLIDGGVLNQSKGSTIISICDEIIKVIREGEIVIKEVVENNNPKGV